MSDDAPEGGFAVADGGARWTYSGALTFANAEAVLDGARALPLPSSGVADLSGLAHADSSALAVLLALRRRAAGEGGSLTYASAPGSIVSLARVYGVDALVGV